MIKLLYTFSEEMKRKSIYIWDVSKDSITEFTKLAFRKIDIKGFVTQEETYIGEWYMNRPVVGVEDVLRDKNAIVILSEKCERSKLPVDVNQKAFLVSELLKIDEQLKEKRVYIYGAGVGGESIYAELENAGINVEAFCTTMNDKLGIIHNKRIYQIDEIENSDNNAFIISVLHENVKQEIIDVLDTRNADMYIRDFLLDEAIFRMALFQSVHKAWYEKKRIYIYTKTLGSYFRLLKEILELYGIEIKGLVYKEASEKLGIQDVYELVYANIQNIYVLINDLDIIERKDQIEVYNLLESIGLSMNTFDFAGFYPVSTADWHKHITMIADPLVGWSGLYGNEELPGVHIIGNMNEDNIRIVVLGGSTSTDGIYRTTSWVRQLYQKLVAYGLDVTIYNCAGPGEDALQELLRLIRDGIHLRPQYIVSMSGVNNEAHRIEGVENKTNLRHTVKWCNILAPDAPFVCGIPVREAAFDYWYRMQRIIKAVSELNESKFLCFLQPIKEAKENLSILERSIHFTGDTNNEIASFRLKSRQDDFYINLLTLFDEKEGMFIDNCHYSEEAGMILSEIVGNELLKGLKTDVQTV